jgi:hypothetical protein
MVTNVYQINKQYMEMFLLEFPAFPVFIYSFEFNIFSHLKQIRYSFISFYNLMLFIAYPCRVWDSIKMVLQGRAYIFDDIDVIKDGRS